MKTKTRKNILTELSTGAASIYYLAEGLNRHPSSIRQSIHRAVKAGLIREAAMRDEGAPKAKVWCLTNKGRRAAA